MTIDFETFDAAYNILPMCRSVFGLVAADTEESLAQCQLLVKAKLMKRMYRYNTPTFKMTDEGNEMLIKIMKTVREMEQSL